MGDRFSYLILSWFNTLIQILFVLSIQLLLNKGSKVNQVYTKTCGFTPLHLTAIRGDLWACKLLLLHGAYAFAKDNQGRTPIEVAQNHPLVQTWMELYRGSKLYLTLKKKNCIYFNFLFYFSYFFLTDYVPPLKQICCWEIRKCLGSKTLWFQDLPIPKQLQEYLTDHELWVLPVL